MLVDFSHSARRLLHCLRKHLKKRSPLAPHSQHSLVRSLAVRSPSPPVEPTQLASERSGRQPARPTDRPTAGQRLSAVAAVAATAAASGGQRAGGHIAHLLHFARSLACALLWPAPMCTPGLRTRAAATLLSCVRPAPTKAPLLFCDPCESALCASRVRFCPSRATRRAHKRTHIVNAF